MPTEPPSLRPFPGFHVATLERDEDDTMSPPMASVDPATIAPESVPAESVPARRDTLDVEPEPESIPPRPATRAAPPPKRHRESRTHFEAESQLFSDAVKPPEATPALAALVSAEEPNPEPGPASSLLGMQGEPLAPPAEEIQEEGEELDEEDAEEPEPLPARKPVPARRPQPAQLAQALRTRFEALPQVVKGGSVGGALALALLAGISLMPDRDAAGSLASAPGETLDAEPAEVDDDPGADLPVVHFDELLAKRRETPKPPAALLETDAEEPEPESTAEAGGELVAKLQPINDPNGPSPLELVLPPDVLISELTGKRGEAHSTAAALRPLAEYDQIERAPEPKASRPKREPKRRSTKRKRDAFPDEPLLVAEFSATETKAKSDARGGARPSSGGRAARRGSYDPMPVFRFSENQLYPIHSAPKRITDIVLQPGEQIVGQLTIGDPGQWMISTSQSVHDGQPQQHIFARPLRCGAETNLAITTDRRAYSVELSSECGGDYMAAVRWRYPEDEAREHARALAELRRKSREETELDPRKLDFGFRVVTTKGKPAWKPVNVFTDGARTFIRFPRQLTRQNVPELFLAGVDGSKRLAFEVKGDLIVISERLIAAELRRPNSETEGGQDVVRINRVR